MATARIGKPQGLKFAPNRSVLAREIGCSRPTLYELLADPDNPGEHSSGEAKYDVAAWKKFFAKKLKKPRAHHDVPMSAKDAAITRKNEVSAQREEFALSIVQREHLSRREVNQALDTANGIVRREIDKAIDQELPPRLEGMSAMEIRKTLRKKFDQIFEALPKRFLNARGDPN